MHCIPMEINYKLSLSAEEIREILLNAKLWGMTPQKAIEAILREWCIQRKDLRKAHLRQVTKE